MAIGFSYRTMEVHIAFLALKNRGVAIIKIGIRAMGI